MYIWILLATIIVALSFFNTSPREDKASVFNEVKAATFINRFRAEHLAFQRVMECELLYSGASYGPQQQISTDLDVGYTSIAANLPLGYNPADNASEIYHYVYCFDSAISNTATLTSASTKCGSSQWRYAISFTILPDRWISKETATITLPDDENEYEVVAPLPSFTNYLAKELTGIKNTGWMWCEPNTCHLVGRSAIQMAYEEDGTDLKYIQFTFPSSLLNETNFSDVCRAGNPCLFSFDKLRNSDRSNHCRGLINRSS